MLNLSSVCSYWLSNVNIRHVVIHSIFFLVNLSNKMINNYVIGPEKFVLFVGEQAEYCINLLSAPKTHQIF